jgi:hypothetical protein
VFTVFSFECLTTATQTFWSTANWRRFQASTYLVPFDGGNGGATAAFLLAFYSTAAIMAPSSRRHNRAKNRIRP